MNIKRSGFHPAAQTEATPTDPAATDSEARGTDTNA